MAVPSFRGVVARGVFTNAENFALAVSHPHPDNDFGGGPGPVHNWRLPSDDDAYRDLVDDDAGDPDDARYEVDEYRHLAVCDAGHWSLHELPGHGTIDQLEQVGPQAYRVLVSSGGGAFYTALLEHSTWHTLEYSGLPKLAVEPHVCFSGDELIIACSHSFNAEEPSQVAIAKRHHERFSWEAPLPPAPARVRQLASALTPQGTRQIIAGGQGLWRFDDGRWVDVNSYVGGELTCLSCAPDGEILAGTSRGDVLGGEGCRVLGRVGPVQSVIRFGAFVYATDAQQVYRFGPDGFEKCFCPRTDSAGDWPRAGRLAVGGGRLWLAGSHDLVSTSDGVDWVLHPVASSP